MLQSTNCFSCRTAYPSPRQFADTLHTIVSCCLTNAMKYMRLANYSVNLLTNVDLIFEPEQMWIRNAKGEAPDMLDEQDCRNCCANFSLHWCLAPTKRSFLISRRGMNLAHTKVSSIAMCVLKVQRQCILKVSSCCVKQSILENDGCAACVLYAMEKLQKMRMQGKQSVGLQLATFLFFHEFKAVMCF